MGTPASNEARYQRVDSAEGNLALLLCIEEEGIGRDGGI